MIRRRFTFAEKREMVRWRREARELGAAGFRRHETDWEIHRGALYDHIIVEARISRCGKYVYTRLAKREAA